MVEDMVVCLMGGDRRLSQLSQGELAELYRQEHFRRYIRRRGKESRQQANEEA